MTVQITITKKVLLIVLAAVVAAGAIATALVIFLKVLPEKREQKEWQEALRQYYDGKVALYREENQRYADYEVDVAFLGDSLTDGYDLATYYPQYVTVNRGIGGDTTHGLEARLEVSAYAIKPKVVVMLIGVNNIDTMFENYERILQGFAQNLPETKVVLVSLTAMGLGWAERNEKACYNNVKIKALAEKYDFSFVDLYSALFNAQTGEIHAEYTTDGGHLTAEGYRVFTDTVTPAIEAALAAR